MRMDVEVDRDKCVANAVCMSVLPEVFDVDDQGQLRIIESPINPSRRQALLDAVASCPTAALSIREKELAVGEKDKHS
jgi:ferredoxin